MHWEGVGGGFDQGSGPGLIPHQQVGRGVGLKDLIDA